MEHGLGTLLDHLWAGHGHPGVQPEPLLPTGDPAPPVPVQALPTLQGPQTTEQGLLELSWEWGHGAPGPCANGRWPLPRPLAAGNTLAWVHMQDTNINMLPGLPGP